MTMSTFFSASSASVCACSFALWKRLITAMRIGKVGEPLAEGARVLVGEDRRGHEHGDLTSALHRLERGAHGDLRLAVADVADEQAVHRTRALHVAPSRRSVALR